MRKVVHFIAAGLFVLSLFLVTSCATTQPQRTTGVYTPVMDNPWIGLWEGKDTQGDIYSLHFTATEWEMYIEKNGITIPFYKGTYTHTSSRVNLQVTEEVDTNTMTWMPHLDNFPPITGRLIGNVLNVPIFTDADLVKEP